MKVKLKESFKIKPDGTLDWESMTPEEEARFRKDLAEWRKDNMAEFGTASDDGEDIYDLVNDNYHNPHENDENWDLNDHGEELLTDFREIPDSEDYEEAIYESLNRRKPVILKEYTHWEEYGDGYSDRYGDYDDDSDIYEDDLYDDDGYLDGLDFYGDEPLENEDFYDTDDFEEDEPSDKESEIGDSIIYPEDDDADDFEESRVREGSEQGPFYAVVNYGNIGGTPYAYGPYDSKEDAKEKARVVRHYFSPTDRTYYHAWCRVYPKKFVDTMVSKGMLKIHESKMKEANKARYTSAEVLMYFKTREDRDKAFSILLDHEEDVYKCDAHYTPAFPGSEGKGAIDRAIIIYCDLYGSYDIAKKDILGKDKAGQDVVVPIRHTQYVEMDEEVNEFVEDMASLLPVDVVDFEYRGVLDESKKMSSRLREGGDIAYIFDEEGFKESGIYDKLAEVYGQKIADIFLDWVKSPEYKDGRFVITYEWGPESAIISASDLMDFDMAPYYAELFSEHKGTPGIKFNDSLFGSFMSKSYMDRALVRIESTKDDVRFIGKSGPMNHLNGDISMFEDDEI